MLHDCAGVFSDYIQRLIDRYIYMFLLNIHLICEGSVVSRLNVQGARDSFRRTRSYLQIGKHIHFVNSHKTSLPLPQATDSARLDKSRLETVQNDELHVLVPCSHLMNLICVTLKVRWKVIWLERPDPEVVKKKAAPLVSNTQHKPLII